MIAKKGYCTACKHGLVMQNQIYVLVSKYKYQFKSGSITLRIV